MNKTPIEIAALVFGMLLIIGLFIAYRPTLMNAAKGMGYRVVSLFGGQYVAHRYSYTDDDRMHDGSSKPKSDTGGKERTPIKPSVKPKPSTKPTKPKKSTAKPSTKKPTNNKPTTKPKNNNKPSTKPNKPSQPAKPVQPKKPAVKPSKPNKPANKKPASKPKAKPSNKPVTPAKPNKPAVKPQPKPQPKPKKPVIPAKPKVVYAKEKVIFLNTDKKPIDTQTVSGKKNSVVNVNAPSGYEYMDDKMTKPVTIKGDYLAVEVQSIKASDTIKFISNGNTIKTATMTGNRGTDVTGIVAPTHYSIIDNPKFTYDGSIHDVDVKENTVTNYAKVFDYDTGKQVGMTSTYTGLAGTAETVTIPNGYHVVENTYNHFNLTNHNGTTIKVIIEKTRPAMGQVLARLKPMPGTPPMPGINGVMSVGHNEKPFTDLNADKQSVSLPFEIAKITGNVPKKYYGGETQKFTIWYKLSQD